MKTVNISDDQHWKLKRLALDRKTTVHQIVHEAIAVILSLSGKKVSKA